MTMLKTTTCYAALAMSVLAAPVAVAQQSSPSASAPAAADIVVTGTRRTDRSITESAIPVDVLSGAELQQQPSGDMNNILRNLVPSFNLGRNIGINSDGTAFVRPPTLRGLPPDQVLVLVNGKRRHRSALVQLNGGSLAGGAQAVDLSQIPSIAIERVEVLRDGAAAQYGSDAIAGVINYGLRRAPGLDMSFRYGQTYKGDGDSYHLAASGGVELGDRGFINVSGEYIRSLETSRGGDRPGSYALRRARPDLAPNLKYPAQLIGDPDVKSYRIFVNSGYEFSEAAQFYAFGNYGYSHQESEFNYRQPYAAVGPAQSGVGTQNYPASSVFNPIYLDQLPNGTWDVNGRTFSFLSIYPYGYNPRFMGDIYDKSLTAGLKGTLESGFTYDLSASRGQSNIDYTMDSSANLSLGPQSPTSFYMGSLEQRETNFNLDLTYPLEVGFASPITLAAGAEHRTERYIISQGQPESYAFGPYGYQVLSGPEPGTGRTVATQAPSTNGFPGFGPNFAVNKPRRSYAFYVDAEGDLTEAFSLGIAGRYEHFSDFGSTTNGKISARYELSDALAVRGAASTGFRAPTPGQLFTTAGITGFVGANPTEFLTVPADSAAAQLFGSSPLKPEKSVNLSAGFVVTPTSTLNLTVDYYNIKVTDRIGQSQNFQIAGVANEAQLRDQLRDVGVTNWATLGSLRYFTNAFATRTQGVDVVLSHRMSTGIGQFNTTLTGNYNATKVIRRDARIINDVRKGDLEQSLPRIRASLSETFSTDRLTIVGRANYFHHFTDWALPADGGNKRFGAEATFDLEARYQINEVFAFAVGGENILNNYPDKDIRNVNPNPGDATWRSNWYESTQGTVTGGRYYDASPFGYNGGFWYVRLTAKFN